MIDLPFFDELAKVGESAPALHLFENVQTETVRLYFDVLTPLRAFESLKLILMWPSPDFSPGYCLLAPSARTAIANTP